MQRIAAPMIGGMASALLLTLLVLPAVFQLWKRREMVNNPFSNIKQSITDNQ
jgi:Cu(I)/Ag(I) efflux system membrane protein CusA/SilA